MFKELSKEKVSKVEEEISKKWQQMNLLEKSIETRKNSENFVFYDGPATANGMPGLHHMLAKFLKDSFCKYKTMQGYHVLRKIGWDTHGLPVEVQVEKEMGFHSKKDIEDFGIKEFNEKCRASVWENKEEEMKQLAEHILSTRQLLCSSCQTIFLDTEKEEALTGFCREFLPFLEQAAQKYPFSSMGEAAEVTLRRLDGELEGILSDTPLPFFSPSGCCLTICHVQYEYYF